MSGLAIRARIDRSLSETEAEDPVRCAICLENIDSDSNRELQEIVLDCCHQRLHFVCLARHFCNGSQGRTCPLCRAQCLSPDHFARFEQECESLGLRYVALRQESIDTINDNFRARFPPEPDHDVEFLCCHHSIMIREGPPPSFADMPERNMQWSPYWNRHTQQWHVE